ncbi:2880_t:CDS:2 [Acaulospora colombiana]|uniref:2880_t:CDS:1 n=1 Tax=Acaulospora colombiana TaxID=27376 RepID=A0ACA9MV86_9GLOM|nr:2880_t:CDS:2 [Acaulospora colombiana]
MAFVPTLESIPPNNATYRMKLAPQTLARVNHTPLNPISFLLRAAIIYPDEIALVHPNVAYPVVYTYRIWAQRIQNLAYALIKAGIRPGDRVAILAPNCLQAHSSLVERFRFEFNRPLTGIPLDAHNGVLAARGVLVCINTRLLKSDIEYIINHSGTKLILVDHEYAPLVKDCQVPTIISKDTGRAGDPYEEFLSGGRRFSQEKGWAGLDQDSGTTGRVTRTHPVVCQTEIELTAERGDVDITRPLRNEPQGWTYPWSCTFAMARQFSKISIVNYEKAQRLPQPISAVVAGAAPTASLIGELEKLNFQVHHVYGLTETYGPFTRNYERSEYATLPLEERARIIARQGHSFAQADEVRVVQIDEDGKRKPGLLDTRDMQPGEVVTRGNIVMKEYFRDPKATEEAFRGGYFASGDIAIRYPDGSISIQDRSKDIIISGGEVRLLRRLVMHILIHNRMRQAWRLNKSYQRTQTF